MSICSSLHIQALRFDERSYNEASHVEDLSDEQLCELNSHLDLKEGFYEIKRRELAPPAQKK